MIDRAFIDESIRMSAEGYVYVFAAVCPTPPTGSLLPLRPVLLPGQCYVHWRDETNIRRTAFIEAVNTMAFDVTVAVMGRVPNRGQERARAACMVAHLQNSIAVRASAGRSRADATSATSTRSTTPTATGSCRTRRR